MKIELKVTRNDHTEKDTTMVVDFDSDQLSPNWLMITIEGKEYNVSEAEMLSFVNSSLALLKEASLTK